MRLLNKTRLAMIAVPTVIGILAGAFAENYRWNRELRNSPSPQATLQSVASPSKTDLTIDQVVNPPNTFKKIDRSTCHFDSFGKYGVLDSEAEEYRVEVGPAVSSADFDGDGDEDLVLTYIVMGNYIKEYQKTLTVFCENRIPVKTYKGDTQ